MEVNDRFLSKVDKISSPVGCWLWIGFKDKDGYGKFFFSNEQYAHRVSYLIHIGEIPEGFLVCHNCPGGDNPTCVNPDHLWLGTDSDNLDDMTRKGRRAVGEQHGRSKLSSIDMAELRDLYSTGIVTQQILADYFGISQPQVSSIVRGSEWRTI